MKLSAIVAALGGRLSGEDKDVEGFAAPASAGPCHMVFVAPPVQVRSLAGSTAGAWIVAPDQEAEATQAGRALIVTDDPRLYYARAARLLHPPRSPQAGVDPRAVIGEGTRISASSEVRATACIGDRVVIGERCLIHPGVVIGDDVEIGDDVVLHPQVCLYAGSRLGSRVVIHAGAVIGADGFGLAWAGDRWLSIPQDGRVRIGDDVEIGANATVDRGALSDTCIETGVRIDNLVQVAHNVHIGAHTAIAACAGIAGSTRIGERCQIGGAAMLVGHLAIAAGTRIGGGTLVSKSVARPGHYASSFPFSSHRDWLTNAAHLRHLDQLVRRFRQVECQLQQLTKRRVDEHVDGRSCDHAADGHGLDQSPDPSPDPSPE